MSSTTTSRPGHWDDLSTAARIRSAAIAVFAEQGFHRATVRAIAERAEVSPALVIHHYRSKDRLRQACDEWVMERLAQEKTAAMGASLPDLQAQLAGDPDYGPMLDYLVAALRSGGELAEGIFDRFIAMTNQVLDAGIAAGTMREPLDREAAVATMVAWSAGASLLGPMLARRLGGDSLLDAHVYGRYAVAALELYTHGLLTDDRLLRSLPHDHPDDAQRQHQKKDPQ